MSGPLIEFQRGDAPELLALSESIGWPHTLEDWETAIACGRGFGHRDSHGRILSSAVLYSYGPNLAALAQVIVREEARGQGLGKRVVEACLDAAGSAPVVLVATPEGFPLYKSLGFRTVENICRVAREVPAGGGKETLRGARAMAESDLKRALEWDRAAYRADRSCVLATRWKRSSGVMTGSGFALKLRRREKWLIGPVIAASANDAEAMVLNLAAGLSEPVQLDVPESQTDLIQRLQRDAFSIVYERPLMLFGSDRHPGDRERVFALITLAHC